LGNATERALYAVAQVFTVALFAFRYALFLISALNRFSLPQLFPSAYNAHSAALPVGVCRFFKTLRSAAEMRIKPAQRRADFKIFVLSHTASTTVTSFSNSVMLQKIANTPPYCCRRMAAVNVSEVYSIASKK